MRRAKCAPMPWAAPVMMTLSFDSSMVRVLSRREAGAQPVDERRNHVGRGAAADDGADVAAGNAEHGGVAAADAIDERGCCGGRTDRVALGDDHQRRARDR